MATQDSQEAPEPQEMTLRERHEAAKAALLAEPCEYTPEELRASMSRKLKPLPKDLPPENERAIRLLIDLMRDPNVTVV